MTEFFFANEAEWFHWLNANHLQDDGIFIVFDKSKLSSSLTPDQALKVALSFGWIDGLIQSIDSTYYRKYFKKRSLNSIWSTRNKALATELIEHGLMMPEGLEAVNLAKSDGRWEKADAAPDDFDIVAFDELIKQNPEAYQTWQTFSPSVKKTYAMSYYTLKQPLSREKRLAVIHARLIAGLKPMEKAISKK